MKKALVAVLFAAGYAMSAAAPVLLISAVPVVLTGCERDSDLEDAAEDAADEIEDAGEEAKDKLD